jgi:hypothetical protein
MEKLLLWNYNFANNNRKVFFYHETRHLTMEPSAASACNHIMTSLVNFDRGVAKESQGESKQFIQMHEN